MSADTFDTLDATRRLEKAGMERTQAEATAETIREAQERLVTKAVLRSDMAALESSLRTAMAELRADIYRALWIQGVGIVAVIGVFIATVSALGST